LWVITNENIDKNNFVKFQKIQKYFEVLWTPKNNSNDILDVFCTHAPLGLQFPHLNSDFLSELCGQNFIVQIRNHLATFYRTYSWARDQEEIYQWDLKLHTILIIKNTNLFVEVIFMFKILLKVILTTFLFQHIGYNRN